jgi:hypothetical protein
MSFDRNRLPDPRTYYESQGLKLGNGKKWVSTNCSFHGGSDSMRINLQSGGFVCMNCGAKGGDVLSYERAITSDDFATACKRLGCWVDDGKTFTPRPTPLPARDALEILSFETLLVAGIASSMAQGYQLSENDRERLLTASGRIQKLHGIYL